MKTEGLIMLAIVAAVGFMLYKGTQDTAKTKTDASTGQPGFGVNFGFTKFGN